MLEISLSAFADAMALFRERCTDAAFVAKLYYDLMPAVMRRLSEECTDFYCMKVGNGTLDDSDDDEMQSASMKQISHLRKFYSKVGQECRKQQCTS